jgi:hypothetical protein
VYLYNISCCLYTSLCAIINLLYIHIKFKHLQYLVKIYFIFYLFNESCEIIFLDTVLCKFWYYYYITLQLNEVSHFIIWHKTLLYWYVRDNNNNVDISKSVTTWPPVFTISGDIIQLMTFHKVDTVIYQPWGSDVHRNQRLRWTSLPRGW